MSVKFPLWWDNEADVSRVGHFCRASFIVLKRNNKARLAGRLWGWDVNFQCFVRPGLTSPGNSINDFPATFILSSGPSTKDCLHIYITRNYLHGAYIVFDKSVQSIMCTWKILCKATLLACYFWESLANQCNAILQWIVYLQGNTEILVFRCLKVIISLKPVQHHALNFPSL